MYFLTCCHHKSEGKGESKVIGLINSRVLIARLIGHQLCCLAVRLLYFGKKRNKEARNSQRASIAMVRVVVIGWAVSDEAFHNRRSE